MFTNLLLFLLFLALQWYCRIRLSFQFLFLFSFRLPCYIVEQHRLNTWLVLVERLSFLRTSILKNKQTINYFVLPPFTLKEIRSIIGGSVFPKVSMALALTISIVADLLDYTAAPLLGMPIVGDVFDLIVMSMLYSITKSKVLFIMNLAEFVPFLGDFLPVYTASTIIWILRESGYDGLLIARRLLRLISSTQSHV
jgi:hypothetical protein